MRRTAPRLDGVTHRTPVLTSSTLDALVGAEVLLKAEACSASARSSSAAPYNAISSLSEDVLARV